MRSGLYIAMPKMACCKEIDRKKEFQAVDVYKSMKKEVV